MGTQSVTRLRDQLPNRFFSQPPVGLQQQSIPSVARRILPDDLNAWLKALPMIDKKPTNEKA